MITFRRVAVAATVAAFVQIGMGGVVRATKSGLGCGDDWPHCGGRLVPALQTRAEVLEFSHRFVAVIVMALAGALLVLALKRHRDRPRLVLISAVTFALVLSQALLGAVVVWLHLDAVSVVAHLATALVLVALLLCLIAAAEQERSRQSLDAGAAREARIAAAAVLLLLLVGSYTSGREAGFVFEDWPLMDGRLIPDLSNELFAIHWLHRVLAAVVGVVVFVVAARLTRRKSELPAAAKLAHVAAGLFAVEVVVGAANVFTALNAAVVTAHLVVGSAIWASFVGIVLVTSDVAQRVAERGPQAHARAVLEGGGS